MQAILINLVAEPPIVVSSPINVSGKNQSNVKVATFTHASGVEPASAFVATINWGDGSTSTGTITLSGTTYTVKGSHTYSQNGSHTVTTTVVEAGGGPGPSASANDMYVWNITAENRTHGNQQDARIDVVVRNDSNTDGLPGSSDAVVAGAKVTIQLFTAAGALVGSDSGKTDSSGNFTSDWFKNLAAGTYIAEVLAIDKDGYRWNKSLDATGNDFDLNGNGLPDQQFIVSASGAAMGALPASADQALSSNSSGSAAVAADSSIAAIDSPRLEPAAIDQAIVAFTKNHRRHVPVSYRSTTIDNLLDELFAAI